MTTNEVLSRLRLALQLSDPGIIEMLELAERPLDTALLPAYFLREEEQGSELCPDAVLAALLEGMILKYRGRKEGVETARPGAEALSPVSESGEVAALDNNRILKKLHIALDLKEADLMAIMKLAGVDLTTNELSALFRKKDHKHYRPCTDQFLRNFLSGLAKYKNRTR